jgi:hypothetical protein
VVSAARRLAALLTFACFAAALQGQDLVVQTSVDRATVRENESFTYIVRAEGRAVGEPDVSFLEQQFDILNQSTATRIQLLNGRTQQVAEWIYQLMPKKTGQFTLPPLQFGDALSNAVTIEVLPALADADELAEIFMEVEVDPESAYVQAQVVYTLRLFVGVSTGRATLTAPPISGGEAIVERLGEDSQYQTVRNGRNFIVRERRYAIFPQQAGALSIGPATFEAMVIPSRGFSRVQRLRSEPVALEVLPAVPPPPELAGAAWLPATQLRLTETWADGRAQFSLGVPRTRTLTIEGEGLLKTQLPELRFGPATGIRQYADQPELEQEIDAAGLTSRRIERYAVIAQNVGEVSIPAAELPWWNVRERRWEVARIEADAIPVAAGTEPDVAPPAPAAAPTVDRELPLPSGNYWPLVSAALGVAWLATILVWLRSRNGTVLPRVDGGGRRKRAFPAAVAPSSRRLLKQLRAACESDDAPRVQRLLLDWAKVRFAPDPPQSLGALRDRLPDALAAEVGALEGGLYGPAGTTWNGARLAQLLADLDSVARPAGKSDDDPLLPLYR